MENIDRTIKMRYCVSCNDDVVIPLKWWEDGPDHWQVELYCGNCEAMLLNRYHQIEVNDFDAWLDDCTDEITRALKRSERESMMEFADKFINALQNDVILPEDFY